MVGSARRSPAAPGRSFHFERDGVTDGINEKGLAAHTLSLTTQYVATPIAPVGVTYFRWARYLLDNCATVAEAVAAMKQVHIVDVFVVAADGSSKTSYGSHVAVEDATGDSAIFEIINGTLDFYHGRASTYAVLTNDPPLPQQLDNLKRYQDFGGDLGVAGGVTSWERFVRLSYYLKHLTASNDTLELKAALRSVLMTVVVPPGAPYITPGGMHHAAPTWWTSIIDFQGLVYHWGASANDNYLQIDVAKVAAEGKLDEGAPTLMLNPYNRSLVGEVSGRFSPLHPEPRHGTGLGDGREVVLV